MEYYLHKIAAEVSTESPKEAERIYGTNVYNGEHTYCECFILTVKIYVNKVHPILTTTNCLGKSHYSGKGYFNADGLLTAVHKGGFDFYDENANGIRAINPCSHVVDAHHLHLLAFNYRK